MGRSYRHSVLELLVDDNVMSPTGGETAVKTCEICGGAESLWLLRSSDSKELSHIKNLNVMVRGLRSDHGIVSENANLYTKRSVETQGPAFHRRSLPRQISGVLCCGSLPR